MKDTNGLPVRFDCDCAECESDLARLEAADQADEIKRLRAQVAELLELARNLDYDFYAVVGTGPYVQHEVLARYPSEPSDDECTFGSAQGALTNRLFADHQAAPPNGTGRISDAVCRHCGQPIEPDGDGWTHRYPSVTNDR